MLIQLLKLVVVKGCANLEIGVPFECPVAVARDLIIEGIAEAADPVEHARVADRDGKGLSVDHRDPAIEQRDPGPKVEKIPKRKLSELP